MKAESVRQRAASAAASPVLFSVTMDTQDGLNLCFPDLLNTSCRKETLHWSEAVLLNTLLSFISLLTAALNLLVITSVAHFRQI